jgi:hypothetical protein
MKSRGKRATATPLSPDRMLRQASMSLDVLEGTLLYIRDSLQLVRGKMGMIGMPSMVHAIDELGFVSNELDGTRRQIGKARAAFRRRRATKRSKPN